VRRRPWEDRFLRHLALAYFHAGYLRQAERVVLALADDGRPDNASTILLLAQIKITRGDVAGGLAELLAAEKMTPRVPGIYTQIGDAYAHLHQRDKARVAYQHAVALDSENAYAWQGLSSIYRREGLNQETVDAALRAVGLLHRLPLAHFNLGVALARSGDLARAQLAFETALRFQPRMINAHRYLAVLHRAGTRDMKAAAFHQGEAQKIFAHRPRTARALSDRSEKLFDLTDIPPQAERVKILLRERPDPQPHKARSGKTFILVSGLPRSGTSVMMQMLEAGGLGIVSDGQRAADIDNPKGYYEWEAIKQIAKHPEVLDAEGLAGRAIKCISMLLPKLPLQHNYKVIFMTRPIEEVVMSQQKMIGRLETTGAELEREQLQRGLKAHRDETRRWLATAPHMELLEVDYPSLVHDPLGAIAKIVGFLGPDRLPDR
jgi:tetratricopeptide (TPR) repeat protein